MDVLLVDCAGPRWLCDRAGDILLLSFAEQERKTAERKAAKEGEPPPVESFGNFLLDFDDRRRRSGSHHRRKRS